MANPFSTALRSFWHTMTSNDRHSTFDSPQRTGRHVPLHNGGSGMLTGVATASDSRADIISPYADDGGRSSPVRNGTSSPISRGYSPGMRSQSAQRGDGFEVHSPGDVPMQAFQDGLPPPPPVRYSWDRIDSWAEENYTELWDQLGEGATTNDLNDLEHQLDCSLPQDVRESLMIHDGQERGGNPTGIIFGSMLMDCEEIVQEWDQWRRVNHQYLSDNAAPPKPTTPSKAFAGNSEASSSKQQAPRPSSSSSASDGEWRQTLLARQGSVPANSVQKAYAHGGWIPLVRDWGGNNLAVDLAPGPNGRWGQIILFGRDYDTKYVVARSWAAFLALVADDLNSGKWFVDDETGELKLREFKDARVEPAYFSILRWRMDQKHGRRPGPNKRQSVAAGKTCSPLGSRSASPYGSPVESNGDARGRSLQRLSASSPLASPMRTGGYGRNPLSRVTEESAFPEVPSAEIEPSTLVEVETPGESREAGLRITMIARTGSGVLQDKENDVPAKMNGKAPATMDDTLKTIEI
ncbi:Glucan synthesis regulatory protein [Metarhizium album ARSEF 1941]|uniref:Glucan synthesis regulatory protein n=1 Tax=Metarhizium album (strain ARSEF 1941) TaxID=1081103 RepID=A0A0B2X3J6_METAS|nr:Glucan synthesis regulatory protein [Metarhizium album ARSEF 1941]KHO00298.1 Glucan synthesis regulatory protein [Metarhizium album ARSEF 1941]